MGYSTDFNGTLEVTPPLNEHERSYLEDFTATRHTSPAHGPLVVDKTGYSFDGNTPQPGKPEIWCHWIADDDGNLTWDEGEKTYGHPDWLRWIIGHLFGSASHAYVAAHLHEDERLIHFTHDHMVNGTVEAQGEESSDRWRIKVIDNDVEVQSGRVAYE